MKVCTCCFNDAELKRFISSISSEKGKCDCCSKGINSELIEIEELLDFFDEFIGIFKADNDGKPLADLIQNDWNLFAGNVKSNVILSEILLAVNSTFSNPYDKVTYTDDIIECTSFWEKLKDDLKWKRRFLTDVAEIIDLGWDGFFNKQSTLAFDEVLFRARIHRNAGQNAFSVEEMGCPTRENTTSGRANPEGIPYLYLSKTIDTTLYETRVTYLDEISIGKFKVKGNKNVVLVDFTEDVSAFINMGNIIEYTKSVLLKKYISIDLSKPIRRYDSELEYIPTQFICEFIRYITGADGILFNSSLHIGEKNIVLFEQDKVECISVEKHRVTNIHIESSHIRK